MNWLEYKFKVPTQYTDTASDIINLCLPYGMYIEDYSDMEEEAPKIRQVDYYSDELLNKDKAHSIIHIYMDEETNPQECVRAITERFDLAEIPYEESCDEVDMDAMMSAWKKFYKPTKIGNSLVVVPSWIDYTKSDEELILQMDPGHAFGSGTHESTAFCAAMLEEYINNDTEVLDIGTGSGILAIASLLLGAKSAIGVDIDAQAVETAIENAKINGVADRCKFIEGDLCDKISGRYDVVTANIVADVIISLLPYISNFMKENAVLIVSGIIDERRQDVETAVIENGFTICDDRSGNGWVALALNKNSEER